MINNFSGQYRFLSNFYPCRVIMDGLEYSTVEHAYQASKTVVVAQRTNIQSCARPGQAKTMGRYVDIRPDWESIKLMVMYKLLKQKFSIFEFKRLLLLTHNELIIEGNTWGDTYWGICKGEGYNHLGNLLMIIRMEANNE